MVDSAIHAALGHLFHNDCAESASSRCGHRWPLTLGPGHGENVTIGSPADIHATLVVRQRAVFAGVGGEFVERKPNGLSTSCFQPQLWSIYDDTRADEVGEVRQLSLDQVPDLHSSPFIPNQQVLIS
jgi:hypothetical protein